nr:aldehyde dehydrogenase family protein [Salinibacterium xinjiangense]
MIVREMGKPLDQAFGEVDFAAAIYQYYADNGEAFLADEPIALADGGGSAFIRRAGLGVLLGIMPWNFPYYQVARFAGPNIVVGNTILLKHAQQCPESAAAIARIFDDATAEVGAHAGVYVNIYASNDQIATVIADPRLQGVSVTGSERAGAAVAELAGRHLKKVVLELGGSDPFILLSTDDLDAAVQDAVNARLDNNGQSCNGAKLRTTIDGKRVFTPILVVFVALGITDLVFALDSIPAIFGITTDPFIVFTANIFALMGLRQLYFLLGDLIDKLEYLHYGIAFILAFIGVKLFFHALAENELPFINGGEHVEWAPEISTWASLAVILSAMTISVVASLVKIRIDKNRASKSTESVDR